MSATCVLSQFRSDKWASTVVFDRPTLNLSKINEAVSDNHGLFGRDSRK
jgi:hypothetical protein